MTKTTKSKICPMCGMKTTPAAIKKMAARRGK